MIAANNVMNALFMVAGAAAAAALAAMGCARRRCCTSPRWPTCWWRCGSSASCRTRSIARCCAGISAAFTACRCRPGELRAAGDRVVIVANHQSYLDACLIAACLPDSPTFAIHTAQAAKWYFKPFLAAVETFPVDVQSPYSVKRMVEAVRDPAAS